MLDDNTLCVERTGLITKEQLITAYQQILTMQLSYIILDNSNMMYSVESIYNTDVEPWVRQVLQRPDLINVIVILPDDDKLKSRVTDSFQKFDVSHKLMYATSIEMAKNIVDDIR